MSHFSVLVIGDDVEKQLQPYHEYECTGEDDEYVVYVDIMEEAMAEFEGSTVTKYRNAKGELIESDDSFYRECTPEEIEEHNPSGMGWGNGKSWCSKDWGDGKGYRPKMFSIPEGFEKVELSNAEVETLAEFTADYWGLNIVHGDAAPPSGNGYVRIVDGVMTEAFKYTNPNAKWDWYQIGGRWSNMLRLKPIQLLPSTEMFNEFGFSQAEFLNLVNLYKTSNGKFRDIVGKYKGRADDIVGAIETYLRPVYPNSFTGDPGVMGARHSAEGPGRCDQCRIGDLDIDLMEKESIDEALKQFDKFNTEVLDKCEVKTMTSWDNARKMFPGDVDGARAYFHNQEIMVRAREAGFSFWGDDPVERYFVGQADRKKK